MLDTILEGLMETGFSLLYLVASSTYSFLAACWQTLILALFGFF